MLKKPSSLLALGLTIFALILTGCAAEESTSPATGSSSAEIEEVETEPEIILYQTAALNGVRYVQGLNPALEQAAFSAKIDNFYRARPQTGLNEADIVYVQRVEGGLTRFAAVWHSMIPEAVGPLRSVRPMDPDIAAPLGGVIAYSGGQDPFIFAMRDTGLVNVWEDSEIDKETLFRQQGTGKPYEHTLYANARLIMSEHTELEPPKAQLRYVDLEAAEKPSTESGVAFQSVTVTYKEAISRWDVGTAEFYFDADGFALPTGETANHNALLRTQDAELHLDEITGDQLRTKNVVIMNTELDFSFKDPKYGSVPRTVLITEGTGWVFSDGKYIEMTWSKASQSAPIVLKDLSGAEIKLAPGPTWFEFLDTYSATIEILPLASEPAASEPESE